MYCILQNLQEAKSLWLLIVVRCRISFAGWPPATSSHVLAVFSESEFLVKFDRWRFAVDDLVHLIVVTVRLHHSLTNH